MLHNLDNLVTRDTLHKFFLFNKETRSYTNRIYILFITLGTKILYRFCKMSEVVSLVVLAAKKQ